MEGDLEREGEVTKIMRGSNALIVSQPRPVLSPILTHAMTVHHKYSGVICQIHSACFPTEARINFYSFVIPKLWVCDSTNSGQKRAND